MTNLPVGTCFRNASATPGAPHAFCPSSVHATVGDTVFAVMPRGPHSLAILRVSASSPAFDAQYMPWCQSAACAACELTLTMRPGGAIVAPPGFGGDDDDDDVAAAAPPAAAAAAVMYKRANAWLHSIGPSIFISRWRADSSGGVSSIGLSDTYPAELTRMLGNAIDALLPLPTGPPRSDVMLAKAPCTDVGEVMSQA